MEDKEAAKLVSNKSEYWRAAAIVRDEQNRKREYPGVVYFQSALNSEHAEQRTSVDL